MSRPNLVSRAAAMRAWQIAAPDVLTFARALGVSERTAYRYLALMKRRKTRCPHCDGKGVLWR